MATRASCQRRRTSISASTTPTSTSPSGVAARPAHATTFVAAPSNHPSLVRDPPGELIEAISTFVATRVRTGDDAPQTLPQTGGRASLSGGDRSRGGRRGEERIRVGGRSEGNDRGRDAGPARR